MRFRPHDLGVTVLAAALLCAVPASAAAHPQPEHTDRPGGTTTAEDADPGLGVGKNPDGSISPAGSNDWSCVPTAVHPRPVVLAHGTWGNQNDWDVLAPQLKAEGYCVFSVNYGRDTTSALGALRGVYGTGDIRSSAGELAAFVDRVLGATGAARVDLVGHSQGALMSRQYLRFNGGASKVGQLISLVGTNHGSGSALSAVAERLPPGSAPVFDAGLTSIVGAAAAQQLAGSDFVRSVNAGGDTDPGVDYTVIASTQDDASVPPEATFLAAGPGATVHNVWVQDLCPTDTFKHDTLPQSPTVAYIIEQALDPAFTGNPCPRR
ncbi:esterase/lipase family protein [Nocardia sp. NPDC049149]|uniref:esterase/lipase family protein n=1 Tax=Nocardia sp. NPDC049149 TaxID=3364315 RepID=UPI00371D6A9B